MARLLRLEYPGAFYHVTACGNQGHPVFQDDSDRQRFLQTLAETCAKTGWRIHAYVLTANQYQMLLETPQPNLVVGMKWLQGTYTLRFNVRHKLHGHLFQGRYRAVPVDESDPRHLRDLSTLIHLVPAPNDKPGSRDRHWHDYPWSSLPGYLDHTTEAPAWLCTSKVLAAHGLRPNAARGYLALLEEARAKAEASTMPGEDTQPRRGWYVGGEEFRRRLLSLTTMNPATQRGGTYAASQIQTEEDLAAAGRLLRQGLEALDLEPETLPGLPKGAPEKLVLAWWLRKTTTVPRTWLAEHLHMGDVSRVTQAVQCVEPANGGALAELRDRLRSLSAPKSERATVQPSPPGPVHSLVGTDSDFLD